MLVPALNPNCKPALTLLLPQAKLYPRILAAMKPGATLGLSHGFLLGVMQARERAPLFAAFACGFDLLASWHPARRDGDACRLAAFCGQQGPAARGRFSAKSLHTWSRPGTGRAWHGRGPITETPPPAHPQAHAHAHAQAHAHTHTTQPADHSPPPPHQPASQPASQPATQTTPPRPPAPPQNDGADFRKDINVVLVAPKVGSLLLFFPLFEYIVCFSA